MLSPSILSARTITLNKFVTLSVTCHHKSRYQISNQYLQAVRKIVEKLIWPNAKLKSIQTLCSFCFLNYALYWHKFSSLFFLFHLSAYLILYKRILKNGIEVILTLSLCQFFRKHIKPYLKAIHWESVELCFTWRQH